MFSHRIANVQYQQIFIEATFKIQTDYEYLKSGIFLALVIGKIVLVYLKVQRESPS